MAAARLSAGLRGFSLVQCVCVLMLFTAGNSAAVETGPPQRTLSTSHPGYQKLEVNSEHRYPRGGWATRSRHIHGGADVGGDSYSQTRKSIFRDADYGDNTTVLVVSADGTGDFRSVQDAIDQVPDDNTRRTTIYITSGVYE